jgi:O-antigen/teichoic acid export membrane protein
MARQIRSPRPVVLILGASIVSGLTGYIVTALVAARLGPAGYATFAVFWSTLYVVVGAFGGVQQEVTRATSGEHPRNSPDRPARILVFAVVLAIAILALIAGTGPLWYGIVFTSAGTFLTLPLAIGAAAYVLVASLAGVLYGVRLWYPLAALIVIDGVLRLVGVVVVLSFTHDPVPIAWAVALPFPAAVLLIAPLVARHVSRASPDLGYRALSWNVARTIVAATATAGLISGFPFLLRVTSPGVPGAVIGPIILALTLTRAPIVIPLLALQSYLIVDFGGPGHRVARRALTIQGLVLAASIILAALAALIGPWILGGLFGRAFVVGPLLVFGLVASSGLVAAMCVSGPAALALSRHGVYVGGWILALLVTIAVLLLPVPVETRVVLALTLGPASGLVFHQLALRGVGRSG